MSIKSHLINQIKKLPGIKKLVLKNQILEEQLEAARYDAVCIGRQTVDYRLKLKAFNNEKINVVFVCHRPSVWESLHSVYDALRADNNFNVFIVAIPNKKELPGLWLNHEIYESEGAEAFWKEYGCINGYNYETKEWFDLKTLKPDYVFFQQPYNDTRCESYKSWHVAKYAKICYVPYAFDFIGKGVLEETTPEDFMSNVSFYFTQNGIDDQLVCGVFKTFDRFFGRTVISGFPRYDGLDQYVNAQSEAWHFAAKGSFRVMWTPRWCTNEGNCCFFDYKDQMVEYFHNNSHAALLFRPHPQAFAHWNQTGEFKASEAEHYRQIYEKSETMRIDTQKQYFDTIFSSDCLISDTSSFIADYFLTGKPIVYCHKADTFNALSKKMSEGFYWVHNWDELQSILEDLMHGKDILKEKRMRIIEELGLDVCRASEIIKDTLYRDAKK